MSIPQIEQMARATAKLDQEYRECVLPAIAGLAETGAKLQEQLAPVLAELSRVGNELAPVVAAIAALQRDLAPLIERTQEFERRAQQVGVSDLVRSLEDDKANFS